MKSLEENSGIRLSYLELSIQLEKKTKEARNAYILFIVMLVLAIGGVCYALFLLEQTRIINDINCVASWVNNLSN